jgi:hypothetical protein
LILPSVTCLDLKRARLTSGVIIDCSTNMCLKTCYFPRSSSFVSHVSEYARTHTVKTLGIKCLSRNIMRYTCLERIFLYGQGCIELK